MQLCSACHCKGCSAHFPLAVVDFLSSFQIAQQTFLSIISSAMPDWYNYHDFRHCGSDNESKICNGSPSLQSALWQSESRSVKERERILHRLHCAKAGLSVWCLWPSLSLPPPLQCSAVQCTSACQCCTNGLGAATGSFSHVACWQWCGTHGVRGGSVAASASVRF